MEHWKLIDWREKQMRNKTQNSRRTFIKTAALAGGAATVALTTQAGQADTSEPAQETRAGGSRGYRLTPHIEQYYRLARD